MAIAPFDEENVTRPLTIQHASSRGSRSSDRCVVVKSPRQMMPRRFPLPVLGSWANVVVMAGRPSDDTDLPDGIVEAPAPPDGSSRHVASRLARGTSAVPSLARIGRGTGPMTAMSASGDDAAPDAELPDVPTDDVIAAADLAADQLDAKMLAIGIEWFDISYFRPGQALAIRN